MVHQDLRKTVEGVQEFKIRLQRFAESNKVHIVYPKARVLDSYWKAVTLNGLACSEPFPYPQSPYVNDHHRICYSMIHSTIKA